MKNKMIFVFICFVLSACSDSYSIGELFEYLEDPQNGLKSKFKGENKTYTLNYIPKDVMIFNELKGSKLSATEIRKQLGGLEYFRLQIDKKLNKVNVEEKESFYYAYQLERDIYKIVDQDTIRPSLFLLEQGINGADKLSINLAFPEFLHEKERVVVKDRYGDTSSHSFSQEDVFNIPSLKL